MEEATGQLFHPSAGQLSVSNRFFLFPGISGADDLKAFSSVIYRYIQDLRGYSGRLACRVVCSSSQKYEATFVRGVIHGHNNMPKFAGNSG